MSHNAAWPIRHGLNSSVGGVPSSSQWGGEVSRDSLLGALDSRPQPAEGRFGFGAAIIAFLLGLGSRLNVQIVGFLPLSELAILLLAPLLLPQLMSRRTTAVCKVALALALVSFVAQVSTDFVLLTRLDLAARGAARLTVMIVMIPFFTWYMATHTVQKIVAITIGSIPSQILSAYVLRSGVLEGREMTHGSASITWETHWAFLANAAIGLVAIALYKNWRTLSYVAVAMLGAGQIAMGSRAAGAAPIAAAGLTAAYNAVASRRMRVPKVSMRVLLTLAVATAISCFVIYEGYRYAATHDYLGQRARTKFETQTKNRFGLLLGGRAEAVAGAIAIYESPFAGYGSWPVDSEGFYYKACELMDKWADPNYYRKGYPLIPSHSHMIGAWVEGGIFASVFWWYVLYVSARSVVAPLLNEQRLRLWVSITAIALSWHILFSPISGRLRTAMCLSVFLLERRSALLAGADVRARVPTPAVPHQAWTACRG